MDKSTGAVQRQFDLSSGSNPLGAAFDPGLQELHVLSNDPDVVRTYTTGGVLLRSTRADGLATTPIGLDLDPATGEFLLVDVNAKVIQRVDASYTRHIPAPGQPHGVTYDPSSDALWYVSLSP